MGEKSAQKRQLILERARDVFIEKGFKNVTMKDIVEACEISRGGLYLYFENTNDVFMEVLKLEQEDTDDSLEAVLSEESTVADILTLFLNEQKREILKKDDTLTIATYEFFFVNKFSKKDHIMRKKFELGVKLISEIITAGVATGEFYCENPLVMAMNIMFVLEGLKISAKTIGISEKTVDEQLLYLLDGLLIEEE
ncbi:MAG: TetR/AcrR family transcriptional regulator [Clostridia bacterium]|nr:TetR/AcrR family transcriptional regulator [Clostridia bacterium]